MITHDYTEDDLKSRCAEETTKYLRNQTNDSQYCFELFRRLLEYKQINLSGFLIETYRPIMENWTRSHAVFKESVLDADELVGIAFTRLINARSGEKFAGFKNLSTVIGYLKQCINNLLNDIGRGASKEPPKMPIEEIITPIPDTQPAVSSNIELEQLWDCICNILDDVVDVDIARFSFVQRLKPAAIAEEMDMSPHQISTRLYRIRLKLKERIQECN